VPLLFIDYDIGPAPLQSLRQVSTIVLDVEAVRSRSATWDFHHSDGAISMKRSILASLFLLPGISACGGLGQSNPGVLPQAASAPLAPGAAVREVQGGSAALPAAPFTAGPTYRLYVANAGNNSITIYQTSASGNRPPIATISGSNTQLANPWELSEDANGNLYVANQGPSGSILVFAHGATGNVAPIRAIAGPLTGLSTALYAATVDKTTGKVFAMAQVAGGDGGASELLRFASNASGDEAPGATSPGDLSSPWQLAFDSTGKNIIEASAGVCCAAFSAGIYTFEKQFANGANPTELYSIDNFGNWGVADDPTTKTYLVSGADGVEAGIFRFQEDTVGHGGYDGGTPSYTPAVESVITSDTCGSQLALGPDRNIYVVHSTWGGRCATDAVHVYQHDASGSATPLRVLTGAATQLDQPSGILVGK